MKNIYIIFYFFLIGCSSQGYLLLNSTVNDVIVTGVYDNNPLVWGEWGGTTPFTFLKKSSNCSFIYRDSIISTNEFMKLDMAGELKISESDYYEWRKSRGRMMNMTKEEYLKSEKEFHKRNGIKYTDSTYVQRIDIDSILTIIVHPNGYLPIASRPHFVLRSVKHETRCYPFLRPMDIIQNNDTVRFDSFELNCPLPFKPTEKQKEFNGIVVVLECKSD